MRTSTARSRFLQDFLQRRAQFRREDLAHAADARVAPGEFTRRYIAGERARFISPVALYLFTVFLMFAVLNLTGALTPLRLPRTMQQGAQGCDLADDQQAIASLEREADGRRSDGRQGASRTSTRRIAKKKADIADVQNALSGANFAIRHADRGRPTHPCLISPVHQPMYGPIPDFLVDPGTGRSIE